LSDPAPEAPRGRRSTAIFGLLQVGLVVGALVAAFLINRYLSSQAVVPQETVRGAVNPVVRLIHPQAENIRLSAEATGVVQARTTVDLVPQVGGRVAFVANDLAVGGSFEKGKTLFRIDATDYENAVARARADLQRAEADLQLERAEGNVARREWDLVSPGQPIPALVAREPQIVQAEAAVASARANLADARTNLARVTYSLPFDGRVVATSIEEGQTVNAGQAYGEVYRTDRLEVAASLSVEDLARIEPAVGRPAAVLPRDRPGEDPVAAVVARLDAQLDPVTRLASLILTFREKTALLPGSFVTVLIEGDEATDAMRLPPSAFGRDEKVWVVVDGKLSERMPQVLMRGQSSYVVKAFDVGEGVVVTPLAAPKQGMEVEVQGDARPDVDRQLGEDSGAAGGSGKDG